jgi:predicted Zn-dependent protease
VAKTTEHAKELKRASRPPISASPEDFLVRLDGLVVGQRAANGIIDGQTFLHPDFNFLVQFPEKWQIENSPQKILGAAPDGEAAVVLGAAGEGNDPLDGARAVEKATKSTDIASKSKPVTINGLSAAHTQIEADGKVKLDITWIAHGGLIYQVVGIAPTKKFDSLQSIFHSVAHSFRPLTASERANIKEKRIRLVKAQAGDTIEAVTTRAHSAWKTEEVAVANGLAATAQLRQGQVIKVAVEEPYVTKGSRR